MATINTLTRPRAASRMASSQQGAAKVGRKRNEVDTSDYAGKIAVRIRALREASGMTVDDLAKKAKIDVKVLYAYESGARTIPPKLYPKLAKSLGCNTPDAFFPPLK